MHLDKRYAALGGATAWLAAVTVSGTAAAVPASTGPVEGPPAPTSAIDDLADLVGPVEYPDGTIHLNDLVFESWEAYTTSDYFRENGLRCGYEFDEMAIDGGSASDCGYTFTNPSDVYDPAIAKYRIPVVVHVIRNSTGTQGDISMSLIESQIDVLNEDFLALPGTPGAPGTDVQIEFFLATEDPDGNPTTGVTYTNNTTWFNDQGTYYVSLHWDTNRYLNIYTNSAGGGGVLGYVPALPQQGIVGTSQDRVVILWSAFGRFAPIGSPYNRGRTTTHEVGHYLGLHHTFQGGCGTTSCYTTGDYICDTNRQSSPDFTCSASGGCGIASMPENYLNYSYDICMSEFTPEQARRTRCTLEWYRSDLAQEACVESGGDGNGDGVVDTLDLLKVLSTWGCTESCVADANCDGIVDTEDLLIVLANWT